MPRQLSMFDEHPAQGSDERLSAIPDVRINSGGTVGHDVFFAFAAGHDDARAIVEAGGRVLRNLGAAADIMEAGRLHVSLYDVAHYVDAFPREDVSAALRAADRVAIAAFDVVFDRVAKFGDGQAFVFKAGPLEPLNTLHEARQALGRALADAGRRTTRAKPTPHMTFAYGPKPMQEISIEPLRWRAERLLLIDSHVRGHLHEVLGEWPLRA
jgi:2'-5' RNA ligase